MKLLSGNKEQVGWWVRRQTTIDHIAKYGHNPDYTTGAQLDASRLLMDTDIRTVVKEADVVVFAVPSAFLKAALDQLEPDALDGKTCFSAVKGIVPETNQIVGEFLFEHWKVQKPMFGVIAVRAMRRKWHWSVSATSPSPARTHKRPSTWAKP